MASPQPLEIKRIVRTIVYEGLPGRVDAIMERNVQDGEYRWAPGKVTVTTGRMTPDEAYIWGQESGINQALDEVTGPKFAELSCARVEQVREQLRKELKDGL